MSRFDPALIARALAAVRAAQEAAAAQPPAQALPGAGAPPEQAPEASWRARATELAKAIARRFEGLRLRPYLCPAAVPTIGYGATTYLDGRAVQLTDPPISQDAAERLLDRQVREVYQPAAERLCPTADTAGRLAAITDFAFNLGPTRLKASTLRRRALEGDWDAVADEMMRWVYGGGRKLPGLVLRCQARVTLLSAD